MESLYNGYSNEKFNNVIGEYAIYLRKSRADAEAEAETAASQMEAGQEAPFVEPEGEK